MDSTDLLSQGMTLLALGMGTVFVFLALLVIVTNLMSTLVQKYLPQPLPAPARRAISQPAAADNRLIAIITAAVHQHRAANRDRPD